MLSLILCIGLNIEGQAMQGNVIEFSQADELNNWLIVNDTVMGGRSQSIAQSQDRNLHFVGELSLRNNGGFASIRRVHEPIEWHTNTPIQITVKGDGREYQFRLRTNRYMDGVAYVKSFATLKDEWQTISFQEKDFTPQFRGRLVKSADALNFSNITQLGFMLADKQAGTFELLLKEIVQSNPVAVVSEF
jgi:NADH dehydrogenase [ubiquinone] 1 alpha subcomplex assembly factor 1